MAAPSRHAAEPQPLLVDVRTACAMLSVSRASLYRLIARGQIRSVAIGGGRMRRFAVADLEDYVQRAIGEYVATDSGCSTGTLAILPGDRARRGAV